MNLLEARASLKTSFRSSLHTCTWEASGPMCAVCVYVCLRDFVRVCVCMHACFERRMLLMFIY